jgi:23S rRNA pseudouridine1911/1915/1917 synthase
MESQSPNHTIAKSLNSDLREFTVQPDESGTRLDIFLAKNMPDWTRSQVQRLLRDGYVNVDGREARKAGDKVAAGSKVTVRAVPVEVRAEAEDLPLEILYEDADLAVVNKPAGMIVHAGAGVNSGTLVNALLHHLGGSERLSAAGGEMRPGIVHRLDRMTSGIVLVAKNDAAHRALAAQFKSREVKKTYLALVHGRIANEHGAITRPVGRDPRKRIRMKAGGLQPRQAATDYRVLRRFANFTYVEAQPRTGRTHQIRVHFASLGHPVAGDTLYGAPARIKVGGATRDTLERNFLHAAAIEFSHPRTGERMKFRAPLPKELDEFLQSLPAKP